MAPEDDLNSFHESMTDVLRSDCDSIALHKFYDGETGLDERLWARAAELGWLGIGLPEVYGGLGMGVQGLDVLYRALGWAGAPGAFIPSLPVAQWLSEVADESLAQDLLSQLVSGTLEFAAPMAPSQSSVMLTAGRLSGVSQPLLISPKASLAVIPLAEGGMALIPVKEAAVHFEAIELWDRTRRAGTLRCDGIEPIAVIEDASGEASHRFFRHLALAVAADSLGGGRRMTEQTVDYLKTRVQFGRPLAGFQALKHRVADLMLELTPAEELIRQALELSMKDDSNADLWVRLAKVSASEAFKSVAEDCVLLHGGVGFTWEFDCHIFLKRALLNELLAGTNASQLDAAADSLVAAARAGVSPAELVA